MLSPNFSPFPQLTTQRLLLRNLRAADVPAVFRLRSNEDVMRYINRPLAQTMEDAAAWVKKVEMVLEQNEGITWCICLKEAPDVHIGNIGLWRIEKENYRAEIGYMLEPELQGKGLMFEALQAVIDYGFSVMNLHTIEAQINPQNPASARLATKAGFVQEALFKENVFWNGKFTDSAVYTLFNSPPVLKAPL